jgi:hypothetical protein
MSRQVTEDRPLQLELPQPPASEGGSSSWSRGQRTEESEEASLEGNKSFSSFIQSTGSQRAPYSPLPPTLLQNSALVCCKVQHWKNFPAKYTVPKAAHISEKYLGVYMGASPLAGKFPKAV